MEKENIKKTLASLPTTKVFKELVSSFLVFFKCLMVKKYFIVSNANIQNKNIIITINRTITMREG